jgi:hypothetical protein
MKNKIFLSFLFILIFSVNVFSQIGGVVTDKNNRVIPGALILLKSTGTATKKSYTDSQGRYSFPATPGDYAIIPVASQFWVYSPCYLAVRLTTNSLDNNFKATQSNDLLPAINPPPTTTLTVRTDDSHLQGDLATRIESAEAELGDREGTIIITGNEPITRTVVVGSHHTWDVSGIHVLIKGVSPRGLVWMKDNSTLISANNGGFQNDITGIVRPRMVETYEGMQPFSDGKFGSEYDAKVATNITLIGIQLKDVPGANPSGSTNAALNFGNCHNCRASRVWFNGLNDFGVQIGANALWVDKYADGVEVLDCVFTEVATQNVAWVHGQNGLIARNTFTKMGRVNQVMTAIDIEANYSPYSLLKKIKIENNVIDFTEALGSYGGIAVTSSAPDVPTEDLSIIHNIIKGKSKFPATNSRKGIEMAGDDLNSPDGRRIVVSDNVVEDFNQICIVAAGDQIQVLRNKLKNCSW